MLLDATRHYMFPHYRETNKIVNMTVLDTSVFYKRKLVCEPPSITARLMTKFFIQTFRGSAFYFSSNNKLILSAAEYWAFSRFSFKKLLKVSSWIMSSANEILQMFYRLVLLFCLFCVNVLVLLFCCIYLFIEKYANWNTRPKCFRYEEVSALFLLKAVGGDIVFSCLWENIFLLVTCLCQD